MKAYTYQIGESANDEMAKPVHSESLYADSLGEAIDKAKAITKLRPPHKHETSVRLVEAAADQYPLWVSPVEGIRKA